ncbi:dehydrogenase/reductase SDR family member 11-like [Lycorma delicatula]|uniref:dehydrogenase/reductase SDR family member 11-like n=1 Tax=Lycorma delicatula TaxID=130591 RepID=UPI003F5144D0
MDRWYGRVALVTGASSGIGAAITKALAINGINVIGIARRLEKVQQIADELKNENGKIYPIKADVTKEDDVVSVFQWATDRLGGVDIVVNNAGTTVKTNIKDGEIKKWRLMFELNVLAMGTCIRETIKSLKSRDLDDGHIINICSVAGHRLPQRMGNYVYTSTKFAAKIITEGLQLELANMKSKIKITNLSPGVVDTEIFDVGGWGCGFSEQPKLSPSEVADAVIYALSTTPDVQIAELTIRPNGEGW